MYLELQVGRDALLVLDLGLHVLDRVRRLDLEGDGLASEGLDENLEWNGAGGVGERERGCAWGGGT